MAATKTRDGNTTRMATSGSTLTLNIRTTPKAGTRNSGPSVTINGFHSQSMPKAR
jgi:hypothetical protein